ncbi:L-serine/L-threonine ammonia-lyase CHA1 [Sugiyamaella lignohabitans]|uniref:L-serine ammonia-lyase n=1 Tax=Sugiyamaella lignohabitans TaxID=796027 RepID=A0A167CPP0_9ASCO|nr:L-serine/L-threonine ammonia-lyase CHA1 [Sugiyamaella lignohabitans]ANB11959.1 L-serine/L-threonine ammonia-lyase CHA1 [Sugiyamaella lignohabitans]
MSIICENMTPTPTVLPSSELERPNPLPLPYIETPLIPSLYLSERVGCSVYLKLEQVQPSGSFKSRGLGNLVYETIRSSPFGSQFHFFSSSGGNAGCATAYAAKLYKQKCTVCVPISTPVAMVERIRRAGANVVVHGKYIADSDKYLREELIPSSDLPAVYCHPYDNELVWEGNSTLASEIVSQMSILGQKKPSAVICSVGGGGMFNGLVQGFQKANWQDVPILAVETEGCATLNKSIKSGGQQVRVEHPSTIARSLSTVSVTRETIDYAMHKHPTHSMTVSDAEAATACIEFANDHKLLIEAACGTALAPLYTNRIHEVVPGLSADSVLVVVVCGGTAVNWEILEQYSKEYGVPLY